MFRRIIPLTLAAALLALSPARPADDFPKETGLYDGFTSSVQRQGPDRLEGERQDGGLGRGRHDALHQGRRRRLADDGQGVRRL